MDKSLNSEVHRSKVPGQSVSVQALGPNITSSGRNIMHPRVVGFGIHLQQKSFILWANPEICRVFTELTNTYFYYKNYLDESILILIFKRLRYSHKY